MFRTATAIAVAALFCAPAMAQTLTVGQYKGTIQTTGVMDPENLCTGGANAFFAFKAGNTSTSVATIAGLGVKWAETISSASPAATASAGVSWTNCTHIALPAATAFTAGTVGTATDYVATAGDTAACVASSGTQKKYSVTSANASGSPAQTATVTILPVSGAQSGFEVSNTNAIVAIGNSPICYVSTDALYAYVQ